MRTYWSGCTGQVGVFKSLNINADCVIFHPPGLTNMMFMPPGGLIVEFVGHFDNVHMPLCGYYGPYAAIFGHHHYTHAYNYDTKDPIRPDLAAKKALEFYNQLRMNDREHMNITTIIYQP